ncbi:MAG: prolipoprotein diacylglyceryl transferase [Deltaproteobacteria bacterium]|jgi:phosphatidylglycerol:prolipoprotein diacylglycerol transferase|nr:prolipoprotein diacylglyceryl transferase [Deltaproteobacteria bacterium]
MKVDFNPIMIDLGLIRVSWYGMMYVLGFIGSYLLVRYQMKKKDFGITRIEVENLYFYLIIGLMAGARLGYVLFYDLKMYLSDPLGVFAIWRGGMSFHGGLIGVLLVGILFSWRNKKSFWKITDLIIVTAPIGLGLGRIGNFINGELYGRMTTLPWGMIFPRGGPHPRHPSQLYESGLEGGVLFLILWLLKDKKLPTGGLLALFLSLYGLFRFFVEFFREPDAHIGFIIGPFTLGQVFSFIMIAGGTILYICLKRKD